MIQFGMTFHSPGLYCQQWSLFERSATTISETVCLSLRLHSPLIWSSLSVTKTKEWSLFVVLMFMCFVGAIGERNIASSLHPQCMNDPASTLLFLCWCLSLTMAVLFFSPTPFFSFASFLYSEWRWKHFILWIVRSGRSFLLHKTGKICFINGIMSVAFVYLFWGS